jgi:integrase
MPQVPARPWFRKSVGKWYVQFRGHQVNLGPDKAEATRRFHELMSGRTEEKEQPVTSGPDPFVLTVIDQFIVWVKKNRKQGTVDWYNWRLNHFIDFVATKEPSIRLRTLAQGHIDRWMDDHPDWSDNYRHGCIRAVETVVNWYCQQWKLGPSPLGKIRKPTPKPREFIFTQEQVDDILAETDEPFRILCILLSLTGARPEELRLATKAHCAKDFSQLKFGKAKGGRSRIIYVPAEGQEILRELAAVRPEGPLLLNSRGKPWSKNAIYFRMKRLRDKLELPDGAVAYALRHTFCTAALEKGIDVFTVAKLMGHQNTEMVARVYAKLGDKHLNDAVEKANG